MDEGDVQDLRKNFTELNPISCPSCLSMLKFFFFLFSNRRPRVDSALVRGEMPNHSIS